MSDIHDANGKFKKGNKANPLGAGAHDKEKKYIKKLTTEKIAEIMDIMLTMSEEQANEYLAKNPTIFNRWLAQIIKNGVKNGQTGSLEFFLQRAVGKVPDVVKHGTEQDHDGKITIEVVSAKKENEKPKSE